MNRIRIIKKLFSLALFLAVLTMSAGKLYAEEYYWENPEQITTGDCRFPQAISNNNSCAIFWEEVDSGKSEVYLSAAFKMADSTGTDYGWRYRRRFAGPFSYSGEIGRAHV